MIYFKSILVGIEGATASDALNNLGLVYRSQRLIAKAITAFRQSIRRNPRNLAPRVNGALPFLRLGETDQGQRWIEGALRLARIDPQTHR